MSKYDVNKVLEVAANEVGYLEKRSNSQLDHKTANAGYANYTKYGRDMHNIYPAVMDFPAAWCDCFVDWCFYRAYGIANAKKLLGGNFNDYTIASAQLYRNHNAFHTINPKVGDQIFFKNSSGKIYHTGLVVKVDNTFVYTIEGNTSAGSSVVANGGGVFRKKYVLSNPRILGYGRPKYDDKNPIKESAGISIKKDIPVLAKGLLKKGARGVQVMHLQEDLNYVMKSKLKVTGIMDNDTVLVLKEFQKKNGLLVDGEYGKFSRAKMSTFLK